MTLMATKMPSSGAGERGEAPAWKRARPRAAGGCSYSDRRGGERFERARQRIAGEVALEQLDAERLVAVGVDKHDRAGVRALVERQPGVGAERNQVMAANRLHQRRAGDQAGKAEEQRRRLAVGDQQLLDLEDLRVGVDAGLEQEVAVVGRAARVRVTVGVVDPHDVESAARLLIDQPAIVGEVMGEPQSGDRQRHRRMWSLRGELFEEAALERLQARAEIAGDERARRVAVDEAGVAQEAAMDEARRRRGFLDRPHHPRRSERGFVGVGAGPAGGALDAGRQLVGIGDEQQRLAADAHRADRDSLAAVRGMAGLKGRAIVGDRVGAGEAFGRRRAPQAGGRVVVGARRGGGDQRESGGENEADEARGQGGLRLCRTGDRSVSRTNDISGFGAILRAGARSVKARRSTPRVDELIGEALRRERRVRGRRRRPNRPWAAPFSGAMFCFQALA